jgi:hypothetical protein
VAVGGRLGLAGGTHCVKRFADDRYYTMMLQLYIVVIVDVQLIWSREVVVSQRAGGVVLVF